MPKVSILMPVYNAERYLAEALESILAQTFKDWELILINDGSTDRSEDIIKQYAEMDRDRIYYIKNDENLKLIKTLNKGITYCGGEYIARMDADDVSLPDRLDKQITFLDSHPEYVMCGTNALVIDNDGEVTGRIKNLSDNDFLQINLLFSPPFIHPSVMIRREALFNNPYDENYKHVEDYELWVRLATQGKVANLQEELLAYRWHDSNVSVLNSEAQDKLKSEIIRQQLLHLGITATDEDLYCHTITFRLYHLGRRQDVSTHQSKAVDTWFAKLIAQNKIKNKYNDTDFTAYLWARWAVLCFSQKRYSKIMFPSFASYRPAVLTKFFKLLLFLKNK